MTTNTTLLALAERVERTEGPSRELDVDIWLATTPGATRKAWSYRHKATGRDCTVDETRDATGRLVLVPEFSASLDAAMTLKRPTRGYSMQGCGPVNYAAVYGQASKRCATPALALLAAILRALAVESEER